MKKNVFLMALAVVIIALCSCRGVRVNAGRSQQFSKQLSVKGFNRIQVDGSMDVIYTQDSTWSVKVVGPKESLPLVKADVSDDGTLELSEIEDHRLNIDFFSYNEGVKIYVSSPDLLGVSLIGSGDFYSKGNIDTDNLDVDLVGSGDILFGKVVCDSCKSELSGSGDLKMSHLTASYLSAECDGSGDAIYRNVQSLKTLASLSGSGDVILDFLKGDEVEADLSGSGDLKVNGTFNHLSQDKSGSGDLIINRTK